MPLHRFFNYVWSWTLDRIAFWKDEEREEFMRNMVSPLPGEKIEATPEELEMDAALFEAAFSGEE
jgi:hypothetical protein